MSGIARPLLEKQRHGGVTNTTTNQFEMGRAVSWPMGIARVRK